MDKRNPMKTTAERRRLWRESDFDKASREFAEALIDDLEELIEAVRRHRSDAEQSPFAFRTPLDSAMLWSLVDEPRPATVEERLAAVEAKVKALEEKPS
jgi:hypothetical protein